MKTVLGRRAYSLTGGVIGTQFRVGGFEFHQPPHAAVVLCVWNGGLVKHIVLVIPVIDTLSKGFNFLRYGRGWHGVGSGFGFVRDQLVLASIRRSRSRIC